jgi:hypothetical protein
MRDLFSTRVADLDAEYRRLLQETRAALEQDEAGRRARREHVEHWVEAIEELAVAARSLRDRNPGDAP